MDKRSKIAVVGTSAVVLLIVIILGAALIEKLTPSDEVMLLTDYYPLEDTEVLVILQDQIYEKKGMLLDGKVYLDYETVIQEFNHRFYWDHNENILTYTTPNEILQVEAGSNQYSVTKSMIKTNANTEYPVVKVFADQVYISIDFVKKYSDMDYEYFADPNRIIINYKWGDYLFTDVAKDTKLREDASIKSPILAELPAGISLMCVDMEEVPKRGFSKVMTDEGIIGYVKNKHIKETYYKTFSSDFKEPEYTSQTRPEKINLVFHQVFNKDAVSNLEALIKPAKGLDVIVPTWFSVNDVSGTVSSIATEEYVKKANDLGLEVWGLVDDFNAEVSMYELLSHTSRRETLSNTLVEAALKYKLNGINIDFEKISSDTGIHFIQFLRELSVKCRNNGIVLSVDNYVPTPYTAYYDREEQGKIIDYVITMAYDEYYAGSEVAGPVASLGFVKDAVTNTLEAVPKEKIIIAIPFYTRLWKETKDGEVSSESFSMTPAENILKDNEAEPEWDETYGSYYAEYEKDGALYRMWQEEDKSIEEKLKVIYGGDVAGIAAWKLGLEKESTWNVIKKYFE
ncbi:MAG: glycosyl hydrolase family 18 [Lachnospiraceae bacterium]|nr:glycosyl hydrolase family 18 [Lachnospiraceae bacterium]